MHLMANYNLLYNKMNFSERMVNKNVNTLCRYSNDQCKHWKNGKCNWLHKCSDGTLSHINPKSNYIHYRFIKDVQKYLDDENHLKYIIMSIYDNYDDFFEILNDKNAKDLFKETLLREITSKY